MNDRLSRRLFAGSAAASGAALLGLTSRAFADAPKTTADFTQVGEPDWYAFTLSGTDRHFGRYSAFGEMKASTGAGSVVLTAADGGQIVGVLIAGAEKDDRSRGHFHFSWRDAVTVAGQVYTNTGRFAEHRPRGLVVIAIITVLIGLLLPAVEPARER